jgi:hypothetical protein
MAAFIFHNIKGAQKMKTRITLAMACFIGFILCSAAVAYMPVLIVRECTHCRAHVVQEGTLSGNTIGAKIYTDGKREAEMLPNHPALVKCPVCEGLFWVEEAEKVDSGFEAAEGKPKVLAPSEKELAAYLTREILPKEKEFYLRLRVWWAANDAWRRLSDPKPTFSPEQLKNLDALLALFDESETNQRILKAEIAREMGRFDECLRLLSYQFEEYYGFVVGFIKKMAEEKVQAVKQLSPEK